MADDLICGCFVCLILEMEVDGARLVKTVGVKIASG